jgi:hypothetical protein
MRSWLDWFRPYPELRTVIVNLKDSETVFRGVVWRRRGPFVILRNATLLSDHTGREATRVDGEVVVQLRDIDFLQVLP